MWDGSMHFWHHGLISVGFDRYVRHLDSTIHAIQIKTKVCQLVDAVSVPPIVLLGYSSWPLALLPLLECR